MNKLYKILILVALIFSIAFLYNSTFAVYTSSSAEPIGFSQNDENQFVLKEKWNNFFRDVVEQEIDGENGTKVKQVQDELSIQKVTINTSGEIYPSAICLDADKYYINGSGATVTSKLEDFEEYFKTQDYKLSSETISGVIYPAFYAIREIDGVIDESLDIAVRQLVAWRLMQLIRNGIFSEDEYKTLRDVYGKSITEAQALVYFIQYQVGYEDLSNGYYEYSASSSDDNSNILWKAIYELASHYININGEQQYHPDYGNDQNYIADKYIDAVKDAFSYNNIREIAGYALDTIEPMLLIIPTDTDGYQVQIAHGSIPVPPPDEQHYTYTYNVFDVFGTEENDSDGKYRGSGTYTDEEGFVTLSKNSSYSGYKGYKVVWNSEIWWKEIAGYNGKEIIPKWCHKTVENTERGTKESYDLFYKNATIFFYYEPACKVTVNHIFTPTNETIRTDELSGANSIDITKNLHEYSNYCNLKSEVVSGDGVDISISGDIYTVTSTFQGEAEINIYYTPGKLYVHQIAYKDKYNDMTSDTYRNKSGGTDVGYLVDGTTVTISGDSNVVSEKKFSSTYKDKSNKDCNYVGYDCTGVSKSGGYNTTSIGFSMQKSDVHLYLYYEQRHLKINYVVDLRNETFLEFEKIKDANRLKSSGNTVENVFFNFTDSFEFEMASNLYYHFGDNNYLKYNHKSTTMDKKVATTDNYGDSFRLAETSSVDTLSSISKISGDYLSHADAYRLRLMVALEPSIKVYVRHYVKQQDGTYSLDNTLANENEVGTINELYNNSDLYNLPNGFSQRKSVFDDQISTVEIPSDFSEYFEIDNADTLYINRSGTIIRDGILYNCNGYVLKYDTKPTNPTNKNQTYTKTDNLQVKINNLRGDTVHSDVEEVYIDYYYTPEDYSENTQTSIGSDAKLTFTSYNNTNGNYTKLNSNNDSVLEGVAYVPASEYLRPSIITQVCRPRNIKYNMIVSNNTVKQELKNYTAYSVNTNNNTIVGTVNGVTGADKSLVYNEGNSTNIYVTGSGISSIDGIRKDSINTLKDDSTTSSIFKSNDIKSTLNSITSNKTEKDWFDVRGTHLITSSKYNGLRDPNGVAYYREYNLLDNTNIDAANTTISNENSQDINVYTPSRISNIKVESGEDVVDHTTENTANAVIQQNANFTLYVDADNTNYADVYTDYNYQQKYINAFYIKFDFDVKYIDSVNITIWEKNGDNYNRKNVSSGYVIPAGSIMRMKRFTNLNDTTRSASMKFNVYALSNDSTTATYATYDKIKVYATTINEPSEDYSIEQIKQSSTKKSDSGSVKPYIDNANIEIRQSKEYDQETSFESLKADSSYVCSKLKKAVSIGRIFDFEITDCLDVNFKNVFRKSDTNTVNDLTGIAYFAGTKSLLIRDNVNVYSTNYFVQRGNLTRGYVTTIVPLGPYKNTSNEYIQAPKLGYRIAFDVKTSGYFNSDKDSEVTRNIKIIPSYYYISKNGNMDTYNENIELYYKKSSGKYVKFENSDYYIGFTPNDGYRTLLTDSVTYNKENLSTKIMQLKISEAFLLDGYTMTTTSDYGFIQSWYGEFKLPNSTIALAKDENGRVDINKPLTDGYIGVKFEILCIDKYSDGTTVTLSYSKNNQNDNRTNTSQWDYEGYLGYNVDNQEDFSKLKIQFEKGTLNIDTNEKYNKIKGTVMFYDIDDRAAEDFD